MYNTAVSDNAYAFHRYKAMVKDKSGNISNCWSLTYLFSAHCCYTEAMILNVRCLGKNRNMEKKTVWEEASWIKFTGMIITDNDLDLYNLWWAKRR